VRELEFLPEDYLRARFQRQIRFIRSWLLLAMGMAMILWSLQVGAWVRGAQAELLSLAGSGAAVDDDVAKVRMLRAEADAYNRRLDVLQALKPRVTATAILAELADRLPEGVVLEDVSMECPESTQPERVQLRIAGSAASDSLVTEMLAALETTAPFERAVLVESKARPSRGVGSDGGAAGADRRGFVVEVSVAGPRPKDK